MRRTLAVSRQLDVGTNVTRQLSGKRGADHLDLWVDDIDSAHAEVMALGARVLQEPEETDEPDRFRVYADPAGHPFCLCWVVGS
jgi:predicted enzyme related to lactoylglutathione lyase